MQANTAPRLGVLGRIANEHQVPAFAALTLAWSWAAWLPLSLGVIDAGGTTNPLVFVGGFGPPVAAVVVTWLTGRRVRSFLREALHWRVAPRWYLAALALPVAYLTIPNGAVYAFLGRSFEVSALLRRLPQLPLALVALALVGGGQEELGWRGFALDRLQSRYGPVPATLGLGVLWACWHLPLFLTPWHHSNVPFPAYLLIVVGTAFVFTWLYNVTGSVLVTMLLHGTNNVASGMVPIPASEALSAPFPLSAVVGQVIGVWIPVAVLLLLVGSSLGYSGRERATTEPTGAAEPA
ncbi:MAG: lysostaphin resistance A-like protein [Haloarculaceae archaeon]